MKQILLCFVVVFSWNQLVSQELYDDFEGNKRIEYGYHNGKLDTVFPNPAADSINGSEGCGRYKRDSASTYDNLKIFPDGKLKNITSYASNSISALKIKMKVFTSDTPGTIIEIQLGKKGDDFYPSGVHSQYTATTTVQNQWEELEFDFVQKPANSEVDDDEVDKMVIFFSPNTAKNDTYYFDDLVGPELINVGIGNAKPTVQELRQNTPNPARGLTSITYSLTERQKITIKIIDILGRVNLTLLEDKLQSTGTHEILFDAARLPEGIYFYSLFSKQGVITRKMLISR